MFLINMKSGILVYRAEQGEYCKFPVYDSTIVEATFQMIEKSVPFVVNSRISDSKEEIQQIDGALEEIIKTVNMTSMSSYDRELEINSVFPE